MTIKLTTHEDWLRLLELAKAGDNIAQYEIACGYDHGDGNNQYNIDEANYFLGKIYLDGEIVEKSIIKTRIYLKLANADDDHRSAQELLIIIGEND